MVCTSWLVLVGIRKRLEEWPFSTNRLVGLTVCHRVPNCRQQPLSTCRRIDHRATTTLSPVTQALLLVLRNWGPSISGYWCFTRWFRRDADCEAFPVSDSDGTSGHRSFDNRFIWGCHRVCRQPLHRDFIGTNCKARLETRSLAIFCSI